MDPILYWNGVALEADRTAHTRPHDSERVSRGPTGASRTLAIVHLAMHDAWFSINTGTWPTWLAASPVPDPGASADAAVAAAAHATLSRLYPNQKAAFDLAHQGAGLAEPGLADGHAHGLAVAQAVLGARQGDPGSGDDGYAASIARHAHRPDPVNPAQGYHAPHYGAPSRCFAVTTRHTLDDPPLSGSVPYERALAEVRGKGIAPEHAGSPPAAFVPRTAEETLIAIFWAYDGAKGIGTPPRLYNQIVRAVAVQQNHTVAQNARLFALVNTAMGDAGILAWDDKYRHDLWRPVVGIREEHPSMGPTGMAGSGLDPDCDPSWLPLGAPSTNRPGVPNFTPPFPAYPSGHATFGAAALQVTRRFCGETADAPDDLADGLGFVSEELNGVNVDNRGVVRPRHVREFDDGLWGMIEENGRSRVYLGVHWVFDAFAVDTDGKMDLSENIGGVKLGLDIANNLWTDGLLAAAAAGPRPS